MAYHFGRGSLGNSLNPEDCQQEKASTLFHNIHNVLGIRIRPLGCFHSQFAFLIEFRWLQVFVGDHATLAQVQDFLGNLAQLCYNLDNMNYLCLPSSLHFIRYFERKSQMVLLIDFCKIFNFFASSTWTG